MKYKIVSNSNLTCHEQNSKQLVLYTVMHMNSLSKEYTHNQMRQRALLSIHTHTHTHIHTCICTCTYVYVHFCTQTSHTYVQKGTYIYTHHIIKHAYKSLQLYHNVCVSRKTHHMYNLSSGHRHLVLHVLFAITIQLHVTPTDGSYRPSL